MDIQFSQAEILLAKSAFYGEGFLFVENDNNEVYGVSKKDMQWFLKEGFWEALDNDFNMPSLSRINTQVAANIYYEWSVLGTPMEVVHNNYPFTVTFNLALDEQRFFLDTTEETMEFLDNNINLELGEHYDNSVNFPLLTAIYFHLIQNFIKQQQADYIATLLRSSSDAAITIRDGIATNDEFLVRKGLFQALARKELVAYIHFDPVSTNDPQGDILHFNPRTCISTFNELSLKSTYLYTLDIHSINKEPIIQFTNIPISTYAYYCEMLLGEQSNMMLYLSGCRYSNALFAKIAGGALSHILKCHANNKTDAVTGKTVLEKIVDSMIQENIIQENDKNEYLEDCCNQTTLSQLFDKMTKFLMISIYMNGEAPNNPANAIDFNPPTSFV